MSKEKLSELLPCPFCGGKAKTHITYGFHAQIIGACVLCEECGASTNTYITSEAANAAWSRRTHG